MYPYQIVIFFSKLRFKVPVREEFSEEELQNLRNMFGFDLKRNKQKILDNIEGFEMSDFYIILILCFASLTGTILGIFLSPKVFKEKF